MSHERDALRGRIAVLKNDIGQVRSLAQSLRRDLRQNELSVYGEVDLINTRTLVDNVKSLADAVEQLRKTQAEIDRLEEELDG